MRYVRYIGLSHIRQITAGDWRSVGITADPVVWSARNGFAVPLDHFTEDQIRKAIENDPNLVITGEGENQDEEFSPTPQPTDMTPAQLDQTVNAPADVVGSLNDGTDVSVTGSGPSPSRPDVPDDVAVDEDDTFPARDEGNHP